MSLSLEPLDDAIEVTSDDVTLVRYVASTEASKPFVETVALPSDAGEFAGRNLVLTAPHDHTWHLGLFFCQKLIDGINCWESEKEAARNRLHGRGRGSEYEAHESENTVRIDQEVDWETSDGDTLITEDRSVTVSRPGVDCPDDSYLMTWETSLRARDHERRLGSESSAGHYSGLSARFARDLDRGRILLPDGEYDGEEANGRNAKWCDYSGKLDGRIGTLDLPSAGVTFLDDPENSPASQWFTMTDGFGFVAANPTWGKVLTLEPGKPLSFRWGIWVHAGTPDTTTIEHVYQSFSEEEE